jgi:hypothetical protein
LVKKNAILGFQGILGLAVIGAAALLAWSHLGGLGVETRPVRAETETRNLAEAILDYHDDTGNWPRNARGEVDLTVLLADRPASRPILQAAAPAGGLALAGEQSGHSGASGGWLPEIPLDPWGRPYRVILIDTAVAVISTGPDLVLDTDTARLFSRPDTINPCDGDDVGYVLEFGRDGEF